jgi:hypothetical protein
MCFGELFDLPVASVEENFVAKFEAQGHMFCAI